MSGEEFSWKVFWVVLIASFAGFVNYAQRFAGDNPPAWNWLVALTKIFTAGFVGLLTHWLLSSWTMGEGYVNFAIAVAGYGGAETIAFFQQVFRDTISRAAQADPHHDSKG